MKRIDTENGRFAAGNPLLGTPGTMVTSVFMNDLQDEVVNVITAAGIALDGEDPAQLLDAIKKLTVRAFEFDALPESDIGPIVVVGMDGIWEWSTSAYFTGYRHPRCGHWEDGWTPAPLAFQIDAKGGVWSELDPKQKRVIARFRESGLVVPIGSWIAGQGMIADMGGGNWRAVDYRNMHKRADGTDADTANPRFLGSYQKGSAVGINSANSSGVANVVTLAQLVGSGPSATGLEASTLASYPNSVATTASGTSSSSAATPVGLVRVTNVAVGAYIHA